jgi:ubiquinone/menaquinone biosynthesis C-methylase UbiE
VSLDFLQKNWEKFAQDDPFWAVLTCADKKGGKWEIDEFFETGNEEIRFIMERSGNLIKRRGRALDFGCGVGRLTQALANFFQEVIGVDIAPSMIDLAIKYNCSHKCNFVLNTTNTLERFPDNHFDFIYSNITLQHMRARYIKKYLEEFLRILKPSGLAIFQLPSRLTINSPIKRLKQYLRSHLPTFLIKWWAHGRPWMDMNAILKEEVICFLENHRAVVLNVTQNGSSGDYWQSFSYTFKKIVRNL